MKKQYMLLLLGLLLFAGSKAQSISFNYPPIGCNVYNAPYAWTDGDSVYVEFTVLWPAPLNASDENNCWFGVYNSYSDLINYNPFLLQEEWFPAGGAPYGSQRTYKRAFYVGDVTSSKSYYLEVGAYFIYNGAPDGSSEVYYITYTP